MRKRLKVSLTLPQAKKAIAWAQNKLGLHSWRLTVGLGDPMPVWAEADSLGEIKCNYAYKTAIVWLNQDRCKTQTEEIETLFHEIGHIFMHEAGIAMGDETDQVEYRINRLAEVLRLAYEK